MSSFARALTLLAVLLGLGLRVTGASAEPAASAVTPPELIEDQGVAYPVAALRAGFYERVEVALTLELDASGKVERVSVELPQRPEFFEAAVEAGKLLRFEPARRGSRPVPARVKYRYVFEPPPATLVGTVSDALTGRPIPGASITLRSADGSERSLTTDAHGAFSVAALPRGVGRVAVRGTGYDPNDAPVTLVPGSETRVAFRLEPSLAPAAQQPDKPLEVTVRGQRLPPTVTTYSQAEVRQIPGAFGDPFRAIETLPGVTPVASGLPFFFVRGSPPGNVGYLLDGIRVPYLFHVGFGPAVIQPALVERVELYPGGYPARIGRFTGGVVEATSTDPRAELHGEGNLRLFDVGAMAEGGFADGRGTVLLGGRYSYTAAILSLVSPEIDIDYRDYQARASYDVTPRDRLSVMSFGSYDLMTEVTPSRAAASGETRNVVFGTEFYRVDVRLDHAWGSGRLRTSVTLGFDRTNAGFLAGEPRNVVDRSATARIAAETRVAPRVLVRGGADVALDAYRVESSRYGDPDDPDVQKFERVFEPRDDVATGAWVDAELEVARNVEITPGVRIDWYRSGTTSAVGIDPRVTARVAVSSRLRLVHAFGLVHQPPSFTLPLSALTPKQSNDVLQKSLQSAAGVELDLDASTLATATLFHHAFFDMTDSIGTLVVDDPPEYESRSQGSTFGAELYVKRRLTERLGGFVSYTLSRSVRSLGNEHFVSTFDRTHVVNAAVAYDLGRGWRPGARFVFYTGTPTQAKTGGALPPPRTTDVERDAAFYRLDVRLEKRWALSRSAWISFVVEVMNATLHKEQFAGEEIGPITIPSIGVEAAF